MIQAMKKTFRYSQRGELKEGDQFRVSGGPIYRDKRRLGHKGIFEFRYAFQVGKRVYIEAVEVDRNYGYGQSATLFVKGRSYRRPATPGVLVKTYKVRKLRDQQPI